ncbi:hypothetical protein GpartN1_g1606.t1 [Galdieria partita]|uniref:Major facilitator superfamily (MFS) profile domain-containing protein n=1 Tax=Galdieria partita TaxID=83374 RepID=A0A9C7PSQ6_9RHOD|nr:hypothetical protein GpartN1_g1606.t1 [Galdieria partita]
MTDIIDIAAEPYYQASMENSLNTLRQRRQTVSVDMNKKNWSYIRFNAVGTALGFLVNGYMYQVGSLLLSLYVDAYYTVYSDSTLQSALGTSVLYGVFLGLITFGMLADIIGRKKGLIICSCLVILGSILSVSANGTSTYGMFWMIIISRAVVGLGMGGEYTCNVPNVVEDSEDVNSRTRGRRVSLLVMFMEVVGNNAPTLLQLILIAAACRHVYFDSSQKTGVSLPNCNPQVVWRISYGLGLVPCLIVLVLRVRMSDSQMYIHDAKLRKRVYDALDAYIILRHFSSRMIGTIFMWFFIDWINYSQGNFGSVILSKVIGSSLFKTAWIALAQGLCLQFGPLFAALVVDRLGRRKTQVFGWLWLASTQLITAGVYLQLAEQPVAYVVWTTFVFIFQYFVFIPVYLVPAEVYPTRIRATMYGWSSAMGKVGGIIGTTVFPYMWRGFSSTHSEAGHEGLVALRNIQWFYAALEFLGFILAILFVPEYSNVGLRGEDKRYMAMRLRYAAKLAKKVGAYPSLSEEEQEEHRIGKYSLWNVAYEKYFGTESSYRTVVQNYSQMLLARCFITTAGQVDYYSQLQVYYDDRVFLTQIIRRWRLGKEQAEEYKRQAERMGQDEEEEAAAANFVGEIPSSTGRLAEEDKSQRVNEFLQCYRILDESPKGASE